MADAWVAQLVEHSPEEGRVVGSIPTPSTTSNVAIKPDRHVKRGYTVATITASPRQRGYWGIFRQTINSRLVLTVTAGALDGLWVQV